MKKETKLKMIEVSECFREPTGYVSGYCSGYKKAIEESKALEMLQILIDLKNCKETWSDLFQSDKDRIDELIKQATEI